MACSPYGGGSCGSTPTTPVTHTSIGVPVSRAPSQLPFTGGDVVGIIILGAIVLFAGASLLVCSWFARRAQ